MREKRCRCKDEGEEKKRCRCRDKGDADAECVGVVKSRGGAAHCHSCR
ncbi:hypothetical protein OIU77_023425, partial [Salix suchowensis]